jgi:hypothetical protein
MATSDSTPLRRDCPDQCGHFSASQSLAQENHVVAFAVHDTGSPVSQSNGSPSIAAAWPDFRSS